jgi:feruloyl esterase
VIATLLAATVALAPAGRLDCANAMRVQIPDTRITAATAVHPDSAGRQPHCRVEATIDVETHIVALLPDDWNGRFVMGGAGGFVGAVQNQVESSVHEGYATVGTDAGHTGFAGSAEWALGNEQRVIDYGHRAVHRTAEVTKALIAAYYGRPAERSYFIGCSNGGRQALMEAQRYPDDFDGIVAIAPAYNFLALSTAFLRNVQAQYPTGKPDAPVLTPAVLRLVATRVTEACDALDGVRDGILEDPDGCGFRLASLPACPNDVAADNCVTRAQRSVLATITSPMSAGTQRYPGWPLGGMETPEGWGTWITGPLPSAVEMSAGATATLQGVFALQFFKYLVYGDSTWRPLGYDLARAGRDGARVDAVISATNPDLSAFRARGGKLILAHGWSDPALNARATIDYFTAVQRQTPQAASFTRLFLLPGVLHCDGGSGCDDVKYTAVIRAWVEQGEAPSRIVARKLRDVEVVRTHPLCAYPMTARYSGTGSTDDAAAFTCR